MKKRKRFNLSDLAQVLPEMDNEEQRSSQGGDWYFAPDGTPLGYVGVGDTVRVVDPRVFEQNRYSESLLNERGATILSQADLNAQYKVLRSLADGTPVGIASYSDKLAQTEYCNGESYVSINQSSLFYRDANYYNLRMILYHENIHVEQGELIETNLYNCEKEAYFLMMAHMDFLNCTPEFQDAIRRSADKYYG